MSSSNDTTNSQKKSKPMSNAERSKRYRLRHPEKVHEAHMKRYWSDPEKERQRVRNYRKRNPEKIRAYNRKYGIENRQKKINSTRAWQKENPDKKRATDRKYNRNHPSARAARGRNRYARKQKASGSHTGDDILTQYKRQRGKCYYCGCKLGKEYHVDHVIPLSRNGSNGPDNLVVTCPLCNLRKNNKLPHEWPEGGRLC